MFENYRRTHWICVAMTAIGLISGAAMRAYAHGPNQKCVNNNSVNCPSTEICQIPTHCDIDSPHKATNDGPFDSCTAFPSLTCDEAPTQYCKFRLYAAVGTDQCAVAGNLSNKRCYNECEVP